MSALLLRQCQGWAAVQQVAHAEVPGCGQFVITVNAPGHGLIK